MRKYHFNIVEFFRTESASGIVLFVCAVLAMVLANSAGVSAIYFAFLEMKFFGLSTLHWINDGLMAIFFFVVGLEIKRELVSGELSSLKKAALPISAAVGGMIAPAVIYLFLNPQGAPSRGWAIPMATDIAFAVGVLSLFGKRVPLSLKIFLLALAIVDDLGAVLVIAIFYTDRIRTVGLAIAAIGIATILAARVFKIRAYLFYLPIGIVLWVGVLYSGIHATIAGVVLGLLTPLQFIDRSGRKFSPLDDLLYALHPWVSFGIMPIFALSNAGVSMKGADITSILSSELGLGVALGLMLGKPLGILLACSIAKFAGFAELPQGVRWGDLLGVSYLAGIGFTMALFITNLSLPADFLDSAKVSIIAASLASGLLGYFLLSRSLGKEKLLKF